MTGANGFIGKYLVDRLIGDGYTVYKHRRSEEGDLKDRKSLDRYEGIDILYHLAAINFVPTSWEKPDEYINNNISALVNVLEFCRKENAKLVYISSYMYGEPLYLPVDENHRCIISSPYHLSKRIGEEICEFYSTHFNIDVAIIRPFNVYGMGQNAHFLLPKVYNQVSDESKDRIEVFNLAPKRDYIYVEDLVDVLVKLIPHITGCEIYNVGSGKSYSVGEVIEIIQAEFGTMKEVIETNSYRNTDVMDCVADISHIRNVVGSISITPIEAGIHKWHVMNSELSDHESDHGKSVNGNTRI